MLIRSQDKELLIDMNRITIRVIGGISVRSDDESEYHVEKWGVVDLYDYRENVIKALDMIHEAYKKGEYKKAFKIGITFLETFQMPEDLEVEE